MKILLVTCPIRPTPDTFPPIGSLTVMNYVRQRGFPDISLYDIDAFRPDYQTALNHICNERPSVLGISAVVSTAYAFVKRLSLDVKAALPECTIVLGGNLAASAEILLRQTGVDLCVTGEGEATFLKLLQRLQTTRILAELVDVPGLAFLSDDGRLITTGFEAPLPGSAIYDLEWDDLERYSRIDHYIHPAFDQAGELVWSHAAYDARAYEPKRRNKRVATLSVGKGCVSRCTFCHRFDKGIRHIPAAVVVQRLEKVIERYDVGFVDWHIESFGADHRWLTEFCQLIEPLDILWRAGGVRCRTVTPDTIAMMQRAGCTSLIYGFESGSQQMLDVIEKKTDIQANYDAAAWTLDCGMYTVAQLVLGMPGETNRTVGESIDFLRYVYTRAPWLKPSDLSVNYAQALPGTPLYEYGRQTGRIGVTLEDEEDYLLAISDRNASDTSRAINFTDAPTLDWLSWRPRITAAVNWAYLRRFGLDALIRVQNGDNPFPEKGGQAWIPMTRAKPLANTELRRLKMRYLFSGLPRILVYSTPGLRALAAIRPALADEGARLGRKLGTLEVVLFVARQVAASALWHLGGGNVRSRGLYARSLRHIMRDQFQPIAGDDPAMKSLREGR